MIKQLTLFQKKKIISQVFNIAFFDEINTVQFEKNGEDFIKEFSELFKKELIKNSRILDSEVFIRKVILKLLESLNLEEKQQLFSMIASSKVFVLDAFDFTEKLIDFGSVYSDLMNAIQQNKSNKYLIYFIKRILSVKSGIIIYQTHFTTKEWYESAIELQLEEYENIDIEF